MARNTIWLMLVMLAALLLPSAAFAAMSDVPSGTMISNSCTIAAASITTVIANATGSTVVTIYGDTLGKPTETFSGNFGETATFTYNVYNTGNATDSIWVMPTIVYYGTDSGFIVTVWSGTDTHSSTTSTWDPTDSVIVGPISEDGTAQFHVQVTIPATAIGTTNDGDSVKVSFTIGRNFAVTPAYSADDNSCSYAEAFASSGSNTASFDLVTIAGAIFTLTKTGTCTKDGVLSVLKPGATISYRLEYTNVGSGTGVDIVIYDRIDTANLKFSGYDTGAGWTAQWAGAAQVDFSYGAAGWTSGIPANLSNVRWVRFINANVAAAATGANYVRVMIR